ncbi:MAG: hypothetical protein A2168_09220 [Planctomycetes bacterium RBG_13_50_24]|nr:MAG: hypothetical protein A2168_09220 [Planctomycetes bacterium RBG_13_50_24]
MNRSIKYQFVPALISVCILTPLLVARSGKYETELQFEIDTQRSQIWIGARPDIPGQGPVKPTHVAIFHIRRPHVDMPSDLPGILKILKTTAAQSLSEQQQKFLTVSDAITWWGIEEIKNHDTVFLYAVSQEDAKKMVQAYFEIQANDVNARRQEYEQYIKDRKQEIIEIKKTLPEKQKQAEEMEPKFIEIKKTRYFPLSDDEAYETAKETMLEMDKMLDVIDIELAGIREKMSIINGYRKPPQDMQAIMRHQQLPEGMLVKLEQMFVEQTIELKSAEARKQAAIKIRGRDKAFIDTFIEWKNLSGEVYKLKANLESDEKQAKEIEERLTNPEPYMLPPEIYQNKVTIYPVLAEQS